MKKNIEVRSMRAEDWPEVQSIYEEGIATGVATFETDIPDWSAWDEEHLEHSRFVAASNNEVIGWIALAPVSGRCAYNGVAEISIYITESAKGQGVSAALMKAAITSSELWHMDPLCRDDRHE